MTSSAGGLFPSTFNLFSTLSQDSSILAAMPGSNPFRRNFDGESLVPQTRPICAPDQPATPDKTARHARSFTIPHFGVLTIGVKQAAQQRRHHLRRPRRAIYPQPCPTILHNQTRPSCPTATPENQLYRSSWRRTTLQPQTNRRPIRLIPICPATMTPTTRIVLRGVLGARRLTIAPEDLSGLLHFQLHQMDRLHHHGQISQ